MKRLLLLFIFSTILGCACPPSYGPSLSQEPETMIRKDDFQRDRWNFYEDGKFKGYWRRDDFEEGKWVFVPR